MDNKEDVISVRSEDDRQDIKLRLSITKTFTCTGRQNDESHEQNPNLSIGKLVWSVKRGNGIRLMDFSRLNTSQILYKRESRSGLNYRNSFTYLCSYRKYVENLGLSFAIDKSRRFCRF
jgi:hypothetical protein